MFARTTAPSLTDLVKATDFRSLMTPATPLPSYTIPGDDSTTATVSVGETVYDTLDYWGDRDWFQLALTAGDTVSVSLYGIDHDTTNGCFALGDSYLTIYDSDGNVVAYNDDYYSLDSFLWFTADETETYFVEVAAWADSYDGDYGLTVEEYEAPPPPEDYVAGDISTDATLSTNDYLNGALETAGDTDWYEMELAGFSQVYIDLYAWDYNWDDQLGALVDPILRVYDSGGNLLVEDSYPYGYGSYLNFSTTTAGTYYVEVASVSGGIGEFELYTYGTTSTYEGEIGKTDFVVGTIDDYGVGDVYSIEMTAGDTVRVVLKGRDLIPDNGYYSLYDPDLTVYDDDGNVVAYNDDQRFPNTLDSALIFTAAETGTYYIEANDLYGYDVGDYVLRTFDLTGALSLADDFLL